MASKRALASLAQACSTRTVSSPQLRALATATTGFNAVRTQWRSSRTFITRANRPALAVPAQPWCAPARRAAYSSDPLPGEEKPSKIWKFEDVCLSFFFFWLIVSPYSLRRLGITYIILLKTPQKKKKDPKIDRVSFLKSDHHRYVALALHRIHTIN